MRPIAASPTFSYLLINFFQEDVWFYCFGFLPELEGNQRKRHMSFQFIWLSDYTALGNKIVSCDDWSLE